MIVHIVLFRPHASLTHGEEQEFITAFETAMREIPGVQRVLVGRRVTHGRGYEALMPQNLTHAALLEFDDLAALRAYLSHPAHQPLGAQLFAKAESVLIYDYEMGSDARQLRP